MTSPAPRSAGSASSPEMRGLVPQRSAGWGGGSVPGLGTDYKVAGGTPALHRLARVGGEGL